MGMKVIVVVMLIIRMLVTVIMVVVAMVTVTVMVEIVTVLEAVMVRERWFFVVEFSLWNRVDLMKILES